MNTTRTKIAALCTSALVALGVLTVGVQSASAHTGDLKVSAVCNVATGQYDLTATLTTSVTSGKTGSTSWRVDTDTSFDGTPNNANNMDRGPVASVGDTTVTLGTFSLPGTTTGKGPWVYGYTVWNGATKGSYGQLLSNLAGDCAKPVVIPNSISTSHTQVCGSATVTLRNVSPWIYPVSFVVDGGAPQYGATVDNRTNGGLGGPQKDASNSKTFSFPEDSGTHTIKYRVDAGSENNLYKNLPVGEWTTITVDTNCITPPPVPCAVSGIWYTEGDDQAPVLTIDGQKFIGGSGDAVGYRIPVTGNLSGLPTISYDAEGSTEVFYFRIVIDSSADGGHPYSSLTVTSGSPVTPASVAYSNKLDTSKTLAEWAAFYDDNAITSVGFHLDSAASEDQSVVLHSVTSDCGSAAWGIPQPEDESGTDPTTGDPVCVDPLDGTATVETWGRDWTQAYVPNEDRTAYVLGEKSYGEPYLISTETVDAEKCDPTPVVPGVPTFQDKCGFVDDTVILPEVEGVSYELTWSEDGNTAYVVATAEDGFVLSAGEGEELQTSWTFTFTNEACPTTVVTEEPKTPTGLADTGISINPRAAGFIALGVVLAGALIILLVVLSRRGRKEDENI